MEEKGWRYKDALQPATLLKLKHTKLSGFSSTPMMDGQGRPPAGCISDAKNTKLSSFAHTPMMPAFLRVKNAVCRSPPIPAMPDLVHHRLPRCRGRLGHFGLGLGSQWSALRELHLITEQRRGKERSGKVQMGAPAQSTA